MASFEIRKTWRPETFHQQIKKQGTAPIKKFAPIPADDIQPTRIFDQLSVIGDSFVVCYVLETTEGIILIDCLYPYEESVIKIETGLNELGLDPANIKAILITHGHVDHYGSGDYFREKYGASIYMSKTDYEYYRNPPETDPHSEKLFPYEVYDFLSEGNDFTLGNTTVHVVETPGHAPGVLSYIFPVTDEGREHMCCLWGGTGVPQERYWQDRYLESALHFADKCEEYGCDVEVSNHPIIDCGVLRYQICREITNGVANPFVIGRDACKRYALMFYDFCKSKM